MDNNLRGEIIQWESGIPSKTLVSLVESKVIKPGKSLDLCVGTGKNAFFLVRKGFEVTGIDIWLKSIENWSELAEEHSSSPKSHQYCLPSLPFEDEKFDFIYDLGCFHHLMEMDRSAFIGEVHRVLKKGGLYLIVVLSDRNGSAENHFSQADIMSSFSNLFKIELIQHKCSVEERENPLYFNSFLMERI